VPVWWWLAGRVVVFGLGAGQNPALTTPLTFAGPPEELDAELGRHLASYVRTHQQTASSLAKAKATMKAAAKAAQEAKRKFEERKKASQKAPLAPVPSSPVEFPSASAPTGTLGLFPACYFPRSRCR
jgi:PRTRC genetic system protein E